jgi:tetratricopeptide (TPR) repeat protein
VQGVEHLKHLLAHLEVLLGDLGRDKEARAVRRRLLGLTEGELKDEESHHPCDLASWRAADRLILDGYDRSEAGDEAGACRLWLAAWPSFLQALDEGGIRGIDDFDEQVSGYGYVQEWTGDLANEIFDAAQQDRQSLEAGLRFTTEFLRRFEPDAKYLIEDVRRAHGLLHASAGRLDEADALYRRWLAEDPRWGWGWINWSACYTYGAPAGLADDDRAIEILQQGAVVPGLRDARDVLEELADHLSFAGREAAAEEVRRRRALLPEAKPDEEDLHDEAPPEPAESAGSKVRQEPIGGEPRRAAKVGRNQQCPCGSGKKFKKCCGR